MIAINAVEVTPPGYFPRRNPGKIFNHHSLQEPFSLITTISDISGLNIIAAV
jgi:hypothetical protein